MSFYILPRGIRRFLRSKVVVRIMWLLSVAAVAAAVLVALELDFLDNFQNRPLGQDILELHEILFLTTTIVLGLLIFGALRHRAQKREIRRRQAAERYALDLAFHDPLTGLPNRRHFMDDVDEALAAAPRGKNLHAVMLMDLNSFKAVNDTYGHPAGDELLIEIGRALTTAVGSDIHVARMGGDEFALVARDLEGPEAAAGLARRIINAVEKPFRTKSGEHRIGIGIGIALAPRDGTERPELVRKADLALYRAKTAGISAMSFFEPAMDAQMREWAFMETELRTALGSGEIAPFYRPNVDLETRAVTSFDVVPEWSHPTLGTVPLQRFVPVAEDSGLIRELTDQVLRRACLDAAGWPDETGLSFRLSDAVMRDPGLALRILAIISDTRFAPRRLEIAIGESALMRNMEESRRLLGPLRTAGIRLALADFGTSYSSIWHLRDLQFDRLKIDRSFIDDMETNPTSAVIVKTILAMGQGLGIAISAEGIEQSNQRDRLLRDGLSEGQGQLFGRPMAAAEASKLVLDQMMDLTPRRSEKR